MINVLVLFVALLCSVVAGRPLPSGPGVEIEALHTLTHTGAPDIHPARTGTSAGREVYLQADTAAAGVGLEDVASTAGWEIRDVGAYTDIWLLISLINIPLLCGGFVSPLLMIF